MSLDPQTVAFTRRQFLHTGLVLASASATLPSFLSRSALGLPMPLAGLSSMSGVPEDHVLVVIQLGGGNDGLNTVIPYQDDQYYRARPGIGIKEDKVVKLAKSSVGLHPALTPLAGLYENGHMAIMQGVGYPNPNRSHFKSMDIWHTGETTGSGNGWLGRYFDSECCGEGKGESGRPEAKATERNNMPGIAIGGEAPLAMQGQKIRPIAFQNADLFRWTGRDVSKNLEDPYQIIARQDATSHPDPESNAAFLVRTSLDAQVSSETIRKAVSAKDRVPYPGSDLARQLKMVASMIAAGLRTRVYYVTMGGYDTHAGQGGENGRHSQLLGQFGAAVKAFYDDLKAQGNDGRVLTMQFSEFGRRVGQNASQGTDHGTAAPTMFFGPMVNRGVLNDHPSLTNLDSGDLRYSIDFRAVYAGVLEGWLGAESDKILEGTFKPAQIIRKA
ncbi:MAG: DUF1501 domain-containing protein [Phycisphaerales bacterium]